MNGNVVKFMAAAGAALAVNQAAAAPPDTVVDRDKSTVTEFVNMGKSFAGGTMFSARILDCKYFTITTNMLGGNSSGGTVDLLAAPATPHNARRLAAFSRTCESYGLKAEV